MKVGDRVAQRGCERSGEELIEFARRAEAQGFSSLGTIDRVVYGNYEPLVALAAAAAVTERIELMTTRDARPAAHSTRSRPPSRRSASTSSPAAG